MGREEENTDMEIDLTLKLDAQDQEPVRDSSESYHQDQVNEDDDDRQVPSPEHQVQHSELDVQTGTDPTEAPKKQDLDHRNEEKVQPFKTLMYIYILTLLLTIIIIIIIISFQANFIAKKTNM